MFRLFRRFFRPMSRPAALLLAWQHRKTLAMWARSIRDEAKRVRATGGRPDPARLKVLLPALWHQRDAAERGTVQSLTVTDDHRVVPGRPASSPSTFTTSAYAGVDVPLGTEVPVSVG
jgi:hypothetical protein